ncbi:MAG: GntR family transcriptional regulator [Microvirga sp.]
MPADRGGELVSGTNYGRVGDAIRAAIVRGTYPPGARLKVQDLSALYGISSNPIREALQQLQGEGLVVISPNRGATVRRIDEKLIRHIYEISEGLDGIMAGRCAILASREQLDNLRSIQQQLERAAATNQSGKRMRLNGEFHEYLGTITGNFEALDIRRRHQNLIRTIREQYGYAPERIEQIHIEHRAIIEAIAKGGVEEAERAARFHSVRSRDDILSRFRGFN